MQIKEWCGGRRKKIGGKGTKQFEEMSNLKGKKNRNQIPWQFSHWRKQTGQLFFSQ